MPSFAIDLPEGLPADVAREMAKRACYCDGDILGCTYLAEPNQLEIRHGDSSDRVDVAAKVNRLVEKMKAQRLAVQPKRKRSRKRIDPTFDLSVFEQLSRSGELTTEGVGVVSRAGRFLDLVARFDRLFERMGTELFNADRRQYNTLIPSDWLRRAEYFTSFAHSITYAMHLSEDFDRLENFAARHNGGKDLHFESLDEITTPEYCLSPAVCYHAYGQLKDTTFTPEDNGLKVVTASGRCFRYESKNITNLDRLWEFTMREIVFIGEPERVMKMRSKAEELVWRIVELFDLDAAVETASDPFFTNNFNSLRFFQLANELKFELLLPVNGDREIAAASFNYHETFFGSAFNIRTAGGDEVHTGCAAFGLERLVYAALSQIGYRETSEKLALAEQQLISKEP